MEVPHRGFENVFHSSRALDTGAEGGLQKNGSEIGVRMALAMVVMVGKVRNRAYVSVGAVRDRFVHIRDIAIEFVHDPSDLESVDMYRGCSPVDGLC